MLYAHTRYDGQLDRWTIAGGRLTLQDSADHAALLRSRDLGWITPLDLETGTVLLTGGGDGSALVAHSTAGALGAGRTLADTDNVLGTLQHTRSAGLANGNYVVYGGLVGQDGLGQMALNAGGGVIATRVVSDTGAAYAADIAGTATLYRGGADLCLYRLCDGKLQVQDDNTLAVVDHLLDTRGTSFGGAGAGIFVLGLGGDTDTVADFDPAQDRIDLAAWPFLRSVDQLTMKITNTSFTITYGDEVLHVNAADGQPIGHRTLIDDVLIGGARIPQVITPGFAGPGLKTPDLPQRDNT